MTPPDWVYTWAWVVWGLWFLVWETLAIADPGRNDTLTEHVRPLIRASSLGWFLGAAFGLWLLWHFLLEGPQ